MPCSLTQAYRSQYICVEVHDVTLQSPPPEPEVEESRLHWLPLGDSEANDLHLKFTRLWIECSLIYQWIKQKISVAISLQAKYTDLAAAICRRSWCQLLRVDRCRVVSAMGPARPLISGYQTGAATFHSSSSTVILTRLSGSRSRPTATQRMW
jgi:hypothetical protein